VSFLESGLTVKTKVKPDSRKDTAYKGDAKAQYSLGMAYCDGEGVRKNMRYAQAWLGKAAHQGHKRASAKLVKIIGAK
jgi:TPR repeat protein